MVVASAIALAVIAIMDFVFGYSTDDPGIVVLIVATSVASYLLSKRRHGR